MSLLLHPETEIAELSDWALGGHEDRPVVVLSGRPASGRKYLLRAAISQARETGAKLHLATLDFDGYEPDLGTLEDYLRFQLAKRERNDEELVGALTQACTQPSLRDFALAGLAVGLDDASLTPRILGLLGAGAEALPHLVEALEDDEILVVHVVDPVGQFALIRRDLLSLTDDPRFRLAVSCEPYESDRKLTRDNASIRFEVMALDGPELRALVGDRVEAEEAFFESIVDSAGGARGAAAAALEPVLSGGQPFNPLASVNDALEDFDQDTRTRFQTFLAGAALCGDNVPVRSLLALTGVGEDETDDAIDQIDEALGADSELKLFGERFQHPGFGAELVYGFVDPLVPHAIVASLPPAGRQQVVQRLLSYFTQSLGARTRATTRLIVELFRRFDDQDSRPERLELERELSWWTPDTDVGELEALIGDERERGFWAFSPIWMTANTVQARWPPGRALAVLEASRGDDFPQSLLAPYYTIRSGLLLKLERWADANLAAREGLNQPTDDKLLESALWQRLGAASAKLGLGADAERARAKVEELHQQLLDSGDERIRQLMEQTGAAQPTAPTE